MFRMDFIVIRLEFSKDNLQRFFSKEGIKADRSKLEKKYMEYLDNTFKKNRQRRPRNYILLFRSLSP